jgi:DNA mismatch repair protein MutL
LLENAIDAEATKIELIVEEAGRNLVRVVDNGVGMSETDARMAFERHATSKIRSTEDIFHIATKGFRGEALASIAAVAQVELKTKKNDAEVGTIIYIEGGELQFQEPAQISEGSIFSVKNLFYNVPARRKFLKSNNIEFRHIIDEFQRVALAHESIEFSLYHNDEVIFSLRKGSQMQRIVDIFGRKLHPLLVPIKEDLGWVQLHGFVGKPEAAKKARGEQFFFVNGRFFRSPYLNRAVQEAFEGLLQSNYSPSFFLYLELDPEKIDVNIHPQKTEIKFEDENLIFALIRSTIKKSLGIYNVAPSLDFERNEKMDSFFSPKPDVAKSYHSPNIQVDRSYNPFAEATPSKINETAMVNLTEMYNQEISASPSKINLFDDEDDDLEEDLLRLPNGYWVFNKEDKTLLLDLGRIHQIVLSENRKSKPKSKNSQSLLFSLEYHLNEIEKNKYRSIKKYLPDFGFDMVLAEDNVLRINAVPEDVKESQVIKFLENLFEILDYKTEEQFLESYENQWIKVNAKSKYDFLYKTEAEQLLKDFIQIGFPEYTPNGNRTFVEIPITELTNKF